MARVCKLQVAPKMFLPRMNKDAHWQCVLKSQINEAIAWPSDSRIKIATQLPVLDQLPGDKPDITMLKLMTALDNLTQDVGEIFEAIFKQSKMTMTEFSSQLQVNQCQPRIMYQCLKLVIPTGAQQAHRGESGEYLDDTPGLTHPMERCSCYLFKAFRQWN
ncbi:hypothetical protein PSTG_13975 [Puccinia striiformis f. sp. tritici PST-78]|uniref:Uncharacterized protein n=1 Tax=Puccinia striiformis f. sp. tritici PST-78 TaxID=1165861 RepID=A0A0L0V0W7_9BASI|nr:hypothetical protein PSTG_13975 [Puccinia striiformis f. sp. tritici PST-78]